MNPRLTIAAAVATILSSLALFPLLMGGGWFVDGAGAVLTVALVGAAMRWRTLPVAVCLLATLAALFLYLNAMFAVHQSWAGLVPTRASVHHLAHLLTEATRVVSIYQPPVPATQGILLATTAGVGAIGALTDLLAVRLRRPALAGLPLLALFCVPLTTAAKPGGVGGTLVFSAGMAGYLALLSSDSRQRLPLWGHLVHPWHEEDQRGPDTRALSSAGRRIGAAAIAFALVLPLVVPGLKWHQIFPGSGDLNGPPGQQPGLPSPIVSLNQQLQERRPLTVLTYHSSVSQPPYFQIYVLDQLGANTWTLASPTATTPLTARGGLPAPPGLVASTHRSAVFEQVQVTSDLATSMGGSTYLPLPYPASSVTGVGDVWKVDRTTLMVYASDIDLASQHYKVAAVDVEPSQDQLEATRTPAPGSDQVDLNVPPSMKGLLSLARQVTRGSTTEFDKALALQQWFSESGKFTYSLSAPPPTSADILEQFLEQTRRGYCEHFAFAMAVLARLLGIPARVVVGYTAGSQLGNGEWQVTTSDAHAWPELYFQGAGWLRFEPTPGGTTQQLGQPTALPPLYTVPSIDSVSLPGRNIRPVPGHRAGSLTGNTGGNSTISRLNHEVGHQGATGNSAAHNGPGLPIGVIVLGVLVVLAVLPRAARSTARHLRWWRAHDDRGRAWAAWRELRDDLADYQFASRLSDTPRTLARRLAQLPGLSEPGLQALERVCLAAERAGYATSPSDSSSLRQDSATARRALAHASSLRTRLRALVLPASALAPFQAGFQHALDVFGWIDVASTAVWHLVSRRRRPVPRPHEAAPAAEHWGISV